MTASPLINSGNVPGAASRWVERHFGEKSGSAMD